MGAIETECPGFDFRQAGVAFGTGKLFRENQGFAALNVCFDHAIALTDRRLHRLGNTADFHIRPDNQPVDNQLYVMPFLPIQFYAAHLFEHEDIAVDPDADKPGLTSVFENVFMLALLAANLGRHQRDATALFQLHDGINNLGNGLPFYW